MADQCGWNEIRAWIAAHHDSLPQTLVELGRYPMAYRRAIIAAVPPAVREAIWCEHFDTYLGPASTLSPVQQAFVREARAALPSIMAEDRPRAQERARAFEQRMLPLFSRQQAGEIFATLGPPEPQEVLSVPEL